MKNLHILFLLSFAIGGCMKDHSGHKVNLEVDWPSYMEQHNLLWDIFPERWESGPFTGNGLAGSIIWASGDSSKVTFYLCRSDVGKLDFPGRGALGDNRIQIGSVDLKTAGKILIHESSAELDLWNAEATGVIKTTEGEITWRAFNPPDEAVLIIELTGIQGEEKKCSWETDFTWEGEQEQRDGVTTYTVPDARHHPRSEVRSGGHTIAWTEDRTDHVRRLYVAVSSSPVTRKIWDMSSRRNLSSVEDALLSIENVTNREFTALVSEHRNWWHTFYKKSFIAFPRLDLESYYWIQLYKMASSSREGCPMIDNHGVWSVEPVFGFATWDLNVQVIYRLHLKSNHLSLGEPLIRFMNGSFDENTMWNERYGELRAGIRQQTFLRYRFFDTDLWEHRDYEPVDGPAKFLWGCHNYWMQYRYSMDTSMLENLLPMMEGGINAMAAHLEKGAGDTLHIPTGMNWENWVGKDPAGLLAVLDWSLSTAKRIGEMLDYDGKKLARWDSIQNHLADFPIGIYPTSYPDGDPGYMLGREFYHLRQGSYHFGNLPLPYRHWSHLMMLFPLHTVTWDEKDKREIIENSINWWSLFSSGLYDGISTSGYAPCASICMYADMGKTKKIPELINIFLYNQNRGHLAVHNVWPNTLYRETGPVMETPLFFAASLQELYLKSYHGIIKIFPALPGEWKDAAFYNYRAEGGFVVSARYHKGTTEFIQLKSLAGEDVVLEANMESVKFDYVNEYTKIRKMNGNRYEIKMAKGDSLLIYNDQAASDLTIGPIKNQSGKKNSYGLNEAYLERRAFFKDYLRK